jgi:transcriptional regulator with XRE-family HTH domain
MRKVSELLRLEREKQGYTISDVQDAIRVKKDFLKAIESGNFHALPSESYALGFVKSYANFLGLPIPTITAYFRREYKSEEERLPKFVSEEENFKKNPILNSKTIIIVSVLLVVVGYIAFQYSSFFFGPKLVVLEPKEGAVFEKNIVSVSGTSDPYATVMVDGEEVFVDIDGTFTKTIYIFSGEKKIAVLAKNRFGKETREEVTITVK